MNKTTEEILAEGAKGQAEAFDLYQQYLEALRDDVELSDRERSGQALEVHDLARQRAVEVIEERNDLLEQRDAHLRRELFSPMYLGGEGAQAYRSALTQASAAGDEQLVELANLAETTQDRILGKAVFSVAYSKKRPEAMSPYLSTNERARGLLAELTSIPGAGERERAVENAVGAIPEPKLPEVRPSWEAIDRAERSRPRPLVG